MKKLATLLAVFLIGTASVFAQWDCDVNWTYALDADCTPENLPQQGTYHIEVTLTIYDVANGEYVTGTALALNTESLSATTSNFTADQCGVSDYCDESHDNTPNFYLYAVVAFVSSSSQVFCSDNGQNTVGFSCNGFYIGPVVVNVIMD